MAYAKGAWVPFNEDDRLSQRCCNPCGSSFSKAVNWALKLCEVDATGLEELGASFSLRGHCFVGVENPCATGEAAVGLIKTRNEPAVSPESKSKFQSSLATVNVTLQLKLHRITQPYIRIKNGNVSTHPCCSKALAISTTARRNAVLNLEFMLSHQAQAQIQSSSP